MSSHGNSVTDPLNLMYVCVRFSISLFKSLFEFIFILYFYFGNRVVHFRIYLHKVFFFIKLPLATFLSFFPSTIIAFKCTYNLIIELYE